MDRKSVLYMGTEILIGMQSVSLPSRISFCAYAGVGFDFWLVHFIMICAHYLVHDFHGPPLICIVNILIYLYTSLLFLYFFMSARKLIVHFCMWSRYGHTFFCTICIGHVTACYCTIYGLVVVISFPYTPFTFLAPIAFFGNFLFPKDG